MGAHPGGLHCAVVLLRRARLATRRALRAACALVKARRPLPRRRRRQVRDRAEVAQVGRCRRRVEHEHARVLIGGVKADVRHVCLLVLAGRARRLAQQLAWDAWRSRLGAQGGSLWWQRAAGWMHRVGAACLRVRRLGAP